MAEAQAKLQALSEEFTKLQTGLHPPAPSTRQAKHPANEPPTEMQTTISSRQKLEAQKQENSGVKSEFGKLKDDEAIYKLVGPALLKQDKVEAEATVDGRLEFINKEIARQEGQIKETQEKLERVKGDIIRLQSSAQSAAQGKAPAGAAAAGAAKA